MSVLSSLSVDEKLDLIAKLTNSIRNTYTKEQDIETEDPFACSTPRRPATTGCKPSCSPA